MAEPTSCCAVPGGYCARVDTLFNLPGVHVLDVAWHEWRRKLPAGLRLLVETSPAPTGCPGCGVIVEARGRRVRRLHDIPAFGAPVELGLTGIIELHRAGPPPDRPRLPQSHELPTTDDLGRGTTHPPESPMSPKLVEGATVQGWNAAHGALSLAFPGRLEVNL